MKVGHVLAIVDVWLHLAGVNAMVLELLYVNAVLWYKAVQRDKMRNGKMHSKSDSSQAAAP